ncbi:hypothetical protein Taro_032885 [Colocasia esculenta]|uniref:Uncharacterized protein n=1 Tax=Colocasia esculenta TaxID=4460 RepID=A0A843VMF4_COLES|nr:hypothetical protein [Colocasia esculenta]
MDLPSVAARLRDRPVLVCPSLLLVSRTSLRGSSVAVSTVSRTPVLRSRLAYLCLVCSVLGEFPTEPVTGKAHPYSSQARARRRFLYRRPVRSRDVAVLAQRLQQCSFSFFSCTLGLQPVRGRWTRVKHVTGLTGLDEAFHHSWYQSKAAVMADRRDWGGGGDDPEESTQRMIERIWESLTEIRMRMDQQAPVPPMTGEAVPVAPIPPPPGVEADPSEWLNTKVWLTMGMYMMRCMTPINNLHNSPMNHMLIHPLHKFMRWIHSLPYTPRGMLLEMPLLPLICPNLWTFSKTSNPLNSRRFKLL